jgi:uncharacterized protein YihD (DUF1040 family)
MQRDPKRIDIILEVLRQVWKQTPNKRLGQLFVDIDTKNHTPDLYMIEDDRLLQVLEQIYESNEARALKAKKQEETDPQG